MRFHADAIAAGVAAIRAGKNILTDVEMVRTGINKKALLQFGGSVICRIPESGTDHSREGTKNPRGDRHGRSTCRSAHNIGIIAIGNAPTALLKVVDLLSSSHHASRFTHDRPLVIGVPVGFVKALESKILLEHQPFPFITNLSRKGGSPVAAAIVNALIKMAEEK